MNLNKAFANGIVPHFSFSVDCSGRDFYGSDVAALDVRPEVSFLSVRRIGSTWKQNHF